MVRPRSPRFAARTSPSVTAAILASFDTEPLQQLIDVRQSHQHLSRLAALVAADHMMLGELVDDASRARVADVELPLDQRHGSGTLGGHGARGTREQRVELAFGGLAPLPLPALALFEDLLHVAWPALRLPEVD